MKRPVYASLLIVLIMFTVGTVYLTATESGLKWVLSQVKEIIPGDLSFEHINGRLIGPLQLKEIDYRSDELTVSVDSVNLNWKPSRLFLLQIHLSDLNTTGINVKLKETEKPAVKSEGLSDIRFPLGIKIDNFLVRDLSILPHGSEAPIIIKEISLKAELDKTGIQIETLNMITPEADLSLNGDIKAEGGYPLNIKTGWTVHPAGYSHITGSGEIRGTLNNLSITQTVRSPANALLHAKVSHVLQEPHWEADLSVTGLSLDKVNSEWPESEIIANVKSSGTFSKFDIDGTMDLTENKYGTISVLFSIENDKDKLLAKEITLSLPGTKAALSLSGQYAQINGTASFQAQGSWNELSWPIKGDRTDALSRKGTFDFSGTPDNYNFSLIGDISGQHIPYSNVKLRGTGTEKGLDALSLHAELLDGELAADGAISWEPALNWKATLNAKSINPGIQWPVWPGKLNIQADAKGGMKDGKSNVSLDSASVQGELRGYPVKASAVIEILDGMYRLPQLEIYSGSAHLSASGSYSKELDAEWNINIPELGHLLPEGKGSFKGEGKVKGEAALPRITADLTGGGLSFDNYKAGDLAVDINIDTTDNDASVIDIRGENLFVDTQEITSFSLKADGKLVSHTISLSVSTERQTVMLSAEAGYKSSQWEGRLTESKLDLADFGVWNLKQRETFSVSTKASQTGNLCWVNDSASACIQTVWSDKDGLSVNAGLSKIPLSLFSTLLPSNVSADGIFEGGAEMFYDTDTLYGNVSFMVPEGLITYRSDEAKSVTVLIEQAGLDGNLTKDALDMNILLSLKEKGYIKGNVNLPHFTPLKFSKEGQIISGRILAELEALDLIPLFTSDVQKTKGTISSDLNISGTLSAPTLAGHMALIKGGASIPELGITLEDVHLDITSNETGLLHLDGRVSSGKGNAQITGDLHVKEMNLLNASLNIKGDNFEAVRVPELLLVASPDISLRLRNHNIDINGTLLIPEALIEPPDLSGSVQASKDVMIVSESLESVEEEMWKINSSINLKLGDNVTFKGYGLGCRIAGGILLTEEPGRPTHARGELQIVDGLYKAYGQDLTIEKGRLLFVGIIDDPGLDIKAIRRIKEVVAGIRVSGTLQSPKMEVFSVPAMDQSDALSYLLFGRPMNSISGSEGQKLHSTATSAYLSGGGFLAKKIGAAFGLEEVEIEQGDTVHSSTLVLGKYLSPRLYVSYGIGLFEPINTLRMRYNLSRRWLLQTEYGIESGGDILYQREK